MRTTLRKLILVIAVSSMAMLSQNMWADAFCPKPEVIDYENVECLVEDLARVEKNEHWGFVDKEGNEVVSPQYDDISDFSEGLAQASKNGRSFILVNKVSG